ncbi:MAG TPA: ABC transporter substrate-binding protein, partial [Anaerolineaceae bacterium]|nr:ABC transporter substrate-binding protein [Anaerolineaceae bacterium]
MSKKGLVLLSLILIASTILAACGTPPTPVPPAAATNPPQPAQLSQPTQPPAQASQPTQPAQAASPTEATPAQGKFMMINQELQSTWVRNFNPFSPDARTVSTTIMYEPLMVYNKATNQLVPWLADSYSWNGDNTILTFKLQPGVQWSDGQPFTAKDAQFTFNLVKDNSALASQASGVMNQYVDSITAPDDTTLEFKFKIAFTPAVYDLALQLMVPEHIWKDVQDPVTFTNDNPVATGPFTEVTKFQEQVFVVEKNPHYWQVGKPYFQGLISPAYPGNDQANLAIVNGDLDWMGNFIPDIEKTYVAKDPEHNHYYFTNGAAVLIYLNTKIRPFDNAEVRKAISMGIDRKKVVNLSEFDYAPVLDDTGIGDQFKSWKDPALSKATWTNYDPKAANDLLDKAGLKKGADGIRIGPDGKPMKYELIAVSGWTDWISACQVVSQNMKDLGIDVAVSTPEYDSWYDSLSKKNYQWAIGWSSDGPTPYNFYRGQLSKVTAKKEGESADENWNRFVDPEAD